MSKEKLKDLDTLTLMWGRVLILASIILTLILVYMLLKNIGFMSTGNSATGVIIDFEQVTLYRSSKNRGRSSYTNYKSIIEFKDEDNQIIRFHSAPHSINKYDKGDEVTVYYNPNNSYDVKINSLEGGWSNLFILGFFAFMTRKVGRETLYGPQL